jgi:hypothetical protein
VNLGREQYVFIFHSWSAGQFVVAKLYNIASGKLVVCYYKYRLIPLHLTKIVEYVIQSYFPSSIQFHAKLVAAAIVSQNQGKSHRLS